MRAKPVCLVCTKSWRDHGDGLIQRFHFVEHDTKAQRGGDLLRLILLVSSNAVTKELSIVTQNKYSYFGLAGKF